MNSKYYAVINRQGTQVRIKPSHRLLSAYLNHREETKGKLPRIVSEEPTVVELVKKDDWTRIANELRMGFKDSFIKIIDRKNSGGIIIGSETMKGEINNAVKFMDGIAKQAELEKQKEEEE